MRRRLRLRRADRQGGLLKRNPTILQKYLTKFGHSAHSCGDFARIHTGGPSGLRKRDLEPLGEMVQNCWEVLGEEVAM